MFIRKHYSFEISGSAGGGQTWKVIGSIECEFERVFDLAMRDSFQQLTSGKAIFGVPGLGCRGPYEVDNVVIKRVVQ